MNHYTHDEWLAYINNNLPETTHSEIEDHLYSCDQCLEQYMELIENQTEQLPEIENTNFTDELVSKIHFEKTKQSNPFYKHAIFHYGLAAAVTFMLMSSGFFQGLTGFVSTVEASSFTEKEASFSESLMDKTLQLLELVLPHKEEEGNK